MKQACGYDYTNKLQSMYADIALSKNLTDSFRKTEAANLLELVFGIKILTHGCWPLNKEITVNLPIELTKVVDHFTAYYHSQHSGRKLTWLYNLSKSEIIMNGMKRRYHIKVNNSLTGGRRCHIFLQESHLWIKWGMIFYIGKHTTNRRATSVQRTSHTFRPTAPWVYRHRSEIYDINAGSAHQIETGEAMRSRRFERKF